MSGEHMYLRDHVSLFLRRIARTIRLAFLVAFSIAMVLSAIKFVWLWIVG